MEHNRSVVDDNLATLVMDQRVRKGTTDAALEEIAAQVEMHKGTYPLLKTYGTVAAVGHQQSSIEG